jgi:kynurenine formamidase
MKFIDLTIPLGIATPAWPTYEPFQVKCFKDAFAALQEISRGKTGTRITQIERIYTDF